MVRSFHCRNSGQTGMMSINSTACLFILSFLSNNAYCREPENAVTMRFERGNLKEFMGDSADPNFWPVRGRRNDKYGRPVNPHATVYLGGDLSFMRGGRKSSEEETTGVFWAGRGRSNDAVDPDDGNFWAHRGRSFEPWSEEPLPRRGPTAEEPGWVWFSKGRTPPGQSSKSVEDDGFTCSHLGKSKREILRQKLCHLKRKANTLIRELPQSEQFWPVRGKRPKKGLPMMLEEEQARDKRYESWQESPRGLNIFWLAKGRGDGEIATNNNKQPVNATEAEETDDGSTMQRAHKNPQASGQ